MITVSAGVARFRCARRSHAFFLSLLLGALVSPGGSASLAAAPARLAILPAEPVVFVGGDSNCPAVWVDGELRVYASEYPTHDFAGGARHHRSGPALQCLQSSSGVTPDRTLLQIATPAAFGPWFESVIADADGVLWAFYHAEFQNASATRIHPRIGMQVSCDKGETWLDLGIVLDTPEGSDEPGSRLGYGFSGGNGDFSAILDQGGTYVYFVYTQYGAGPDDQGIALARLRWDDRWNAAGNVFKWHAGNWQEPGLGGRATPLLANAGDAHGLRADIDFWWGPSVHWNIHLQRYVILFNRANTARWSYDGGCANWYMTAASLDDPSGWDSPQALVYPEGYDGSWYPQVIGLEPGETDQLAGRVARLFVSGVSMWKMYFLRADEPTPGTDDNAEPIVRAVVPAQLAHGGEFFKFIPSWGLFSDPDGDPLVWSASGLPGWLTFDEDTHRLSGIPPVMEQDVLHEITLRVCDPRGMTASARFTLTVSGSSLPVVADALPTLEISLGNGGSELEVPVGATLTVVARARDPNGDMTEHWLEVKNPAGSWSWEGWLAGEPWAGALAGSAFSSEKTTPFTFTEGGMYVFRSSAIDSHGEWCLSPEVIVRVTAAPSPAPQPGPLPPPSLPRLTLVAGETGDVVELVCGASLMIVGTATDLDGDMTEHWLEIRNPSGVWSWDGWLVDEPWGGQLQGTPYQSIKPALVDFEEPGTYLIRTTAIDPNGAWCLSNCVTVHVMAF